MSTHEPIDPAAELATISAATPGRDRALAIFRAAMRLGGVEWDTARGTANVTWCGAGEYYVSLGGKRKGKGDIGATIAVVKRLCAGVVFA